MVFECEENCKYSFLHYENLHLSLVWRFGNHASAEVIMKL
jgi:hypothetical protein